MTRFMSACAAVIAVAGCSSPSHTGAGGGAGGGGGGGGQTGPQFVSFTPVTRGADYVDEGSGYRWDFEVMMTDASGLIGCSLVTPSASPGRAVSRVRFTEHTGAGKAPVCPNQAVAVSSGAAAVFERWDANGSLTDTVQATGGAVSFTSSPAGAGLFRCDVQVDLSFPGGSFTDGFSFNYDATDQPTPTCVQGPACSCLGWQSCLADGGCQDLACVATQGACPDDGGVGCCDSQAACSGGVCCLPSGTPCNPNAADCCYQCQYLNNSVYQGYYCVHP